MPRMIRHDLKGPVKVDPQDKPVFVCGCGLTKTFPLCDGSHKSCAKEDDATLYVYDKANANIIEQKPDA
jgi:CDGSH-type Zn-finger protein